MSFSSSTATPNSSILGLPGNPTGYQVNVYPNNNQTIYTNAFAQNSILALANGVQVSFGCFLSKGNANANDVTLVEPTEASVTAGNLWIVTEGLVPDTLNIDSTQGDVNGAPPFFSNGQSVNAIPFPENGTIMNAWVYLAAGANPTVNSNLYVRTDGTLTVNPADPAIASNAYSVGYILQCGLALPIATAGWYQLQIVINPRFVSQT